MKTATLQLEHSVNRRAHQPALLLILPALVCFALSPQAWATCQDACLTNNNTVQGDGALLNLTTGTNNTALGFNALLSDTSGNGNTAVGSQALVSNTTGFPNVAIGQQALFSNTTGASNVAIGNGALYQTISGNSNTAIGSSALYANQASNNTAIGWAAATLTSGSSNTAVGAQTLYVNQGSNNCAFGALALGANTTNVGSNNTGIGTSALFLNYGANNTALGYNAGGNIMAGDNNIFIGVSAGSVIEGGDNNIDIGHHGVDGDNGIIRIGSKTNQKKTYIVGINGNTVAGGIAVIVGTDGRLGTTTSSARFKDHIQPMDKASEAILALQPVTFRYKKKLDPEAIPQFGLVAEQVEKVNPELVAYDDDGKPYSVRYEAVNAMLLNEFLKEHSKVEKLEATVAVLVTTVKEQASEMQKVKAQLELRKSAPRTVSNH